MYIEALEDGMIVSFTKKANSGSLYYSLDKQEWNELTGGTPVVNSGEKVYFKGDLVPGESNGIGTFVINKQCNVAGNVMSLLFADSFIGKTDLTGYNYAFYNLFKNCTTIKSAENLILPATILKDNCYKMMFANCTGLIAAPKLPATTLARACYEYMFHGCTSLTSAPELPATTLANSCYRFMFYNCTNLNYIKMLATNISIGLGNWVSNVSPTGTFVKAEGVEIPTGSSGIPEGWTVETA